MFPDKVCLAGIGIPLVRRHLIAKRAAVRLPNVGSGSGADRDNGVGEIATVILELLRSVPSIRVALGSEQMEEHRQR